MKSMTGFAFVEKKTDDIQLSIEIKSYNSRFLEAYVNLPPAFAPLEPLVRTLIAEKCSRGKVDVTIKLKKQCADFSVNVNIAAVQAYTKAIQQVYREAQDNLEISSALPLHALMALESVLEIEKDTIDSSAAWAIVADPLHEAFANLEKEKDREGAQTKAHIQKQLAALETALEHVIANLPQVEKTIQENIKSRFAQLLADNIDENRVLAETALLLMKYTIAEEIARLQAHFAEFHAELDRNERPAKKLDFLCQEINREINTIGSKTPIIEVSRTVVDMKDALENIREQLRNVE